MIKFHSNTKSRSHLEYYGSNRSSGSRRRSRSRSYSQSRSISPSGARNRSRRQSQDRQIRGSSERPKTNRCIGVFGLSTNTSQEKVRDLFSKYGPIERIQMIIDAQTHRSRGFCFIYFQNVADARVAKDSCCGMEIDNRRIRVDFSITQRPHTPTPGIYMGRSSRNQYGRSGSPCGSRYRDYGSSTTKDSRSRYRDYRNERSDREYRNERANRNYPKESSRSRYVRSRSVSRSRSRSPVRKYRTSSRYE
ncbi:transformer-2 sex-determining protein isoform X2 [Drosophila pseudoobscura]|uniref:Transformer-2 sex-determining protein isoform X2 n=1 Tax=Drosophila pseudoobscura pseudoobscura TaxID=46245 RepID=A0A6I8VTE1_DROPS|nr:transformer-2 sex-determining protein isoform X2 [Drosophila pseudoobscura]